MKKRLLLAIILLSLSFCLVSGVGYGEIAEWLDERKASMLDMELLDAKVEYIMTNPTTFLNIDLFYVKNTIIPSTIGVSVRDNRGRFSYKSGIALKDTFKRSLEVIYSFIAHISTDINTDIIAFFSSEEGIQLGMFKDGEYLLQEELLERAKPSKP